ILIAHLSLTYFLLPVSRRFPSAAHLAGATPKLDRPREDEARRPAHDGVAGFVEGDVEPASRKAHGDGAAFLDEPFRDCDGCRGAGAGAARERDAHAALPDDEVDAVAGDATELDVGATGKIGVPREPRTEVIDVGARKDAEQHRVWVARVCHSDGHALAADVERPFAEEADDAHVDRDDPLAVCVFDRART